LNKINSFAKKGSLKSKTMLSNYNSNKSAGRARRGEAKSYIQNLADSSPVKSHGY
jgi:hypothetical protein